MKCFPVLDFEERLQIGDKTRFDASKTFVSPEDANAVNALTVAPGSDSEEYDIFDEDVCNWYLDWIFDEQTMDIVTGVNDKIDFYMNGADRQAVLSADTYTEAELLTEIASKLNAVSGITGVFSATISTNKLTITNSTTQFSLKPNLPASLLPHLAFYAETDASASATGKQLEYTLRAVTVEASNLVSGTPDTGETKALVKMVKLFSVIGDSLFSDDQDLITWEPDIMKWVAKGRSSFLKEHREAQDQIIAWLDREGYTDINEKPYTKFAIVDHKEVQDWSAFLTLSIIFWGISNKKDDVFLDKYKAYEGKAAAARNRAVLRLDIDGDGTVDVGESIGLKEGILVAR